MSIATHNIPEWVLPTSSTPRSIPVIGFGTAAMTGFGTGSMSSDADTAKQAVLDAIKSGYRHLDTAAVYGSEPALGEAIAEALKLGLVGSRDELFITTKLWCNDNHPHLVIPAIKKSLQALQLEYLDLYLVHWPISTKPETPADPIVEDDVVPFDLKGVWAAMEECQRLGLTKSIGVSNFSRKKIQELLSFAAIPPSVNQVEMNPTWQQKKLVEFCKEKGIIITAYSPLGASGSSWGTQNVMGNELLREIANAHEKTIALVCLRWLYEQGVSFVVKSYNKDRMLQNLQIFDWSLTKVDRDRISQINQIRTNNGPVDKIPQDLWEGEDEE